MDAKAAAASNVDVDVAVRGESPVPAVPESKEVAAAAETAPAKPESIDDILARAQRDQIVQRVGPEVERYLPNKDPNAFLIGSERLNPTERSWEKTFVALPWAVFACMLAAPLLLIRSNLPSLTKRAEEEQAAAAERASVAVASRLPDFEVVCFTQMPDILERPYPTLVLIFDPCVYASKIFLPAFRDLAAILKEAGVAVSVAALDLSISPRANDEFLWEYPASLGPHVQLVVPRARDGEAGVVDYDGRLSAASLVEAARSLAGPHPPRVSEEAVSRLELGIQGVRDGLFELLFLEESVNAAERVQQRADGVGFWRKVTRGSKQAAADETTAAAAAAALAAERRAEAERGLDLSGGLDTAIASLRQALVSLQSQAGGGAGATNAGAAA